MRVAFVCWRDYYGKLRVFPTRCEGFPPACLRILIETQATEERRIRERKRAEKEKSEEMSRKDPRPW